MMRVPGIDLSHQKKRRKKKEAEREKGRKGRPPPESDEKSASGEENIYPPFFEGTGGGRTGFNDLLFKRKKKNTAQKPKIAKQDKHQSNSHFPASSKTAITFQYKK